MDKRIKNLIIFTLLCYTFTLVFHDNMTFFAHADGNYTHNFNGTELIEDGTVLKNPVPTYLNYKTDPTILTATAVGGTIYRGWVVWDISSLTNIDVDNIYLDFDCSGNSRNVTIKKMTVNPNSAEYSVIYNNIENGSAYVTGNTTGPLTIGTDQTIILGGTASADLQSAINSGQGWFALGMMAENEQNNDGSTTTFRSKNAVGPVANPQLTLRVTYNYTNIYTFPGTWYENGNHTHPGHNVTAYFSVNPTEAFNVTGGSVEDFYETPIRFTYPFGSGTRYLYTYNKTETFYTFKPDGDYDTYSFDIRDYAGVIGSSNCFLEALRYVNGTEQLVERKIIYNSETPVQLTLVEGKTYRLRILLSDGSYYNLFDFIPETETPPTLAIYGVSFDDQYQPMAQWIDVEIDRPNNTHIRAFYNETLSGYSTVNVTVYYEYRNGTLIGTNHSVGENLAFHWYNAVNTTDYLVVMQIEHGYYGLFNVSRLMAGDKAYQPEPDWNYIGLPTDIISVFIILATIGTVSKYFNYLGLVAGCVVAWGLVTMGWVYIPVWLISLVGMIGVGVALRG